MKHTKSLNFNIKTQFILLFFLTTFVKSLFSQSNITIVIESSDYAIALQTDNSKRLWHTYFGQRLTLPNEYISISKQLRYYERNEDYYNHAYTPSGTWNIAEPALRVMHADKNPSTELEYLSHVTTKLKDNIVQTVISMIDPLYKTEVQLFYKVYQKENVFEQWTVIKNNERGNIELKKYASANLYFRNKDFYLTQYHGTWATEMQPETHRLTAGIKILDSKLGARANLYAPPTFMLSFDEVATEDKGKVMLANLAWSGNYRFDFEKDRYDNLRLIAGANPHAAEYQLAPKESFETPHLIYAYSENGKGEASRNIHRWARKYRIFDGEGDRLTLLNNWEATFFDFDENKIVNLFDGAKKLGVDLFLLDDGWFANKYPRNDDNAGLGDWQENKKKLPNGLGYLVKNATEKGIKFGIWIEPEMVNPKSELYENHLDWIIRQPDRKEYYYRNQLVLDLTNPKVQDHVFGVFDNILTKNTDIAYVKWDCNSIIYNAYSEYLAQQNLPQSHLYMEYVKGLYKVFERVRSKYPIIPIMLCSGGGGRVDYGALQYFGEFWISDNTAPVDRVFMHWDYSHFFPTIAMSAHVTNWDKTASIKYRTDVASMGKLGFDIEVDKLNKDELKYCQEAVKNYNSFSDTLWKGDQYRLQSPYENSFASFQYVDEKKNKSIMFSYLVNNRFEIIYSVEPVQLKGLDFSKKYKVKELNLFPNTTTPIDETVVYSGDYLMKVGLNPKISRERKSVVLEVSAVK
ncbi:alpha-galactosidase [Aquimarina sp. RZ0]|uniref:alpha-galactosidase n=1 Tax=Aquimarina sp. RZ0 TaxID=2607730 RepID=UPI0011F2865D|nr:alpha-galactosidase [Aquimarina sp. RZ0]KAA1243069.1 alpha-galactosidase [Aquimarina sp. RZ0]